MSYVVKPGILRLRVGGLIILEVYRVARRLDGFGIGYMLVRVQCLLVAAWAAFFETQQSLDRPWLHGSVGRGVGDARCKVRTVDDEPSQPTDGHAAGVPPRGRLGSIHDHTRGIRSTAWCLIRSKPLSLCSRRGRYREDPVRRVEAHRARVRL